MQKIKIYLVTTNILRLLKNKTIYTRVLKKPAQIASNHLLKLRRLVGSDSEVRLIDAFGYIFRLVFEAEIRVQLHIKREEYI